MARIVVLDDEPIHLELVATILERAGHEVIALPNGLACLDLLTRDRIDLVVTDIFMPGLNGLQLMAQIRARGVRIPVIGMTGGMTGQIRPFVDTMSRLGAASVLTKPFSGVELLRAIQSSMREGGTPAT
jgi:CheY-like chemotaxis protein